MAVRSTGLTGILSCYLSVHLQDGNRKFKWRRLLALVLAPALIGFLLEWKLGAPRGENLMLVVTVLSVVAAVLIGLLPLAHSILGQANTEKVFSEGQIPLAQEELDRVHTLQDLLASISWAVILLVVGLGAAAMLALLPNTGTTTQPVGRNVVTAAESVVATVIYAVMASTALTFFDVSHGVFEGMESHAESIKRRIRANIRMDRNEVSE